MAFIARQEAFDCEHCGASVEPLVNGSYRNHCPVCLTSKHVDRDGPGDRLSACEGLMEVTGMDYRSGKGWMILHRCKVCGKTLPNIVAPDDDLTVVQRLMRPEDNPII
ncbi:RNHCP domain-containing protein [Candidatus Peregrinibacteria bacterium]|nr:RNHCP domain-containing protein [Candidatus Peregrinibacteria bacterium]